MVRRSIGVGFAVVCLLFVLKTPTVHGQAVYGSIFGTVTDPQGAGVAGAKVTITSVSKGTAEETTTNESGNYTVTHLIPDSYNMKIEAQGFKLLTVNNVQVSADTAAHNDAQLEVGAVTQTVEVSGDVEQLKTDRSDVAIEFNEKYVEDLPLLNRNFTSQRAFASRGIATRGW